MLKQLQLSQERVTWLVLLTLIVIALILKLSNVFNAPVHWDTGIYLNMAVGYFERGILTPLMWRFNPEWNIVSGAGSGYGIFVIIGWTKLFGVSIQSGHLLMYLLGVLNLPIIFLLATRFYGSRPAGLWAMAFFALSGIYARIFYVRMDTLNILACSLVLLLHLEAVRRDKWWLHAAVGVALVAALEVHVLAAYFAGGIGVYHAVQHLRLMWQQRRLVLWSPAIACGLGLALAAALYFLHHIAPNPDIYLEIPRNCGICTPRSVGKELVRWAMVIGQQPLLTIFLVGLALLTAIQRRTVADQHYLLMFGGAIAALIILNPPIYVEYTGHLLPLLALGVGGLFAQGIRLDRPQFPALRLFGMALGVTAVLVLVRDTSFTFSRAFIRPTYIVDLAKEMNISEAEYVKAVTFIRDHIPTTAVIVGVETFYIDLVEYRQFISQYGIGIHGIRLRNETYYDLWQREKPQVFIGDALRDPDNQRYFTAHGGFVEVVPKLWVDQALLKDSAAEMS